MKIKLRRYGQDSSAEISEHIKNGKTKDETIQLMKDRHYETVYSSDFNLIAAYFRKYRPDIKIMKARDLLSEKNEEYASYISQGTSKYQAGKDILKKYRSPFREIYANDFIEELAEVYEKVKEDIDDWKERKQKAVQERICKIANMVLDGITNAFQVIYNKPEKYKQNRSGAYYPDTYVETYCIIPFERVISVEVNSITSQHKKIIIISEDHKIIETFDKDDYMYSLLIEQLKSYKEYLLKRGNDDRNKTDL